MTTRENLTFIDNATAASRPGHYLDVTVDVAKVLKSWRLSLFSYEWLTPEGQLKKANALSADEQAKRAAVEDRLKKGEPLEKPVLGIGIMDNIEIGAARATFMTLAATGARTLPVHIPKTHKDEFSGFLA